MKTPYEPLDTPIDTASQLHRSALRLSRVFQATRPAKGLSLSKLSVLGRLYREGAATATALAGYLRIQPQSLTRLIADLERRKQITRQSNDADRRQSLLKITDTGVQLLLEEIRDQRAKLAQTIAMALTPAEQGMLRLAAGLMDHLAEVIEAGPVALGRPKPRNEASAETQGKKRSRHAPERFR
jgi:DNA-binding MarR family transcriptional regulator